MPRSKDDIFDVAMSGTTFTNSASQAAGPSCATNWIAAWTGNSDFDEERNILRKLRRRPGTAI